MRAISLAVVLVVVSGCVTGRVEHLEVTIQFQPTLQLNGIGTGPAAGVQAAVSVDAVHKK